MKRPATSPAAPMAAIARHLDGTPCPHWPPIRCTNARMCWFCRLWLSDGIEWAATYEGLTIAQADQIVGEHAIRRAKAARRQRRD